MAPINKKIRAIEPESINAQLITFLIKGKMQSRVATSPGPLPQPVAILVAPTTGPAVPVDPVEPTGAVTTGVGPGVMAVHMQVPTGGFDPVQVSPEVQRGLQFALAQALFRHPIP